MKVTRILAALTLVVGFAGAAHAQGCARLSWGTCDPWVSNRPNAGPGVYQVVESCLGISDQNVGTDSNIHIGGGGPVPDCWRFDDAGCQTGSQLSLSPNALSKACPVMKGLNSLTITNFALDAGKEADLRLSITYDVFTPNPATRYTLWLVNFDHSFSIVGPSPGDLSSCGGFEQAENLALTFALYLNTANQLKPLGNCGDNVIGFPPNAFPSGYLVFNGGIAPVATKASTWGQIKGLYH